MFPASLIERAKSGESSAWNELYRVLAPAVAGYLRLRGAREPDDLTSETFIAVFRNIGAFDGTPDQFRSWVFVIAHRRLLDERRKHARHPDTEPLADTLASSEHVEADAAAGMSAERVRSLCAQLPTDQGDVLVLRILADCTIDTIAQVLGRSVGAVKQLQRRGLENLRRLISEQRVPL